MSSSWGRERVSIFLIDIMFYVLSVCSNVSLWGWEVRFKGQLLGVSSVLPLYRLGLKAK